MDLLLDLIVTLSRWSRSHLSDISLALMATLFVLFGPALNAWVKNTVSSLNFFLHTLIFVLVCAVGYAWPSSFSPWMTQGLAHLNNYSLAPVLLLIFFLIGVIADRN